MKCILKGIGWEGVDWDNVAWDKGKMAVCCEHGNGLSGFIKWRGIS
jgi:hypothetical protein